MAATTFDADSGITIKDFTEIRKEIAEKFTKAFDDSLNTASTSPDGMLIDLFAYAAEEAAQTVQAALANIDPATAEGTYLDRIAAIMGLSRNADETDAKLRARMKSATFDGLATFDGMLTYLQHDENVGTDVKIMEDAESRTVTVLVPEDKATAEKNYDKIAQAIWDCKPAGIKTGGSLSGTATDKAGTAHEVKFGVIADNPLTLAIKITAYPEEALPSDWKTLVKASLVDWAATEYQPGKDIIVQRLYAPIYAACDGIGSISITATFNGETSVDGTIAVPAYMTPTLAADNITFPEN